MTPFTARLAPLAGTAAVALALVLAVVGTGAAAGAAVPAPSGLSVAEDVLGLVAARDRSAKADAVVEGLKRALTPGHLVDPLPVGGASFALDALRIDYADMQRRAAGYRATLGEHHPTLAAAGLVLAELRDQILDETRKALAMAERDAAQAHAALSAAERSAAARSRPVEDVTGSIVAPPPPSLAPSGAIRPDAPETTAAEPEAQAVVAPETGGLAKRAAASAGVLMALTAVLWGAVARTRRVPKPVLGRSLRSRRREPALAAFPDRSATPAPAAVSVAASAVGPAPAAISVAASAVGPASETTVPLLARLPVVGRGTPGEVAAALARAPDGALARGAASLLDTLTAALGGGAGRMTVLVLRTEDVAPDKADGAAMALALAAATRGRRVALMEARPAGRLRRSTVPAGVEPMLVAAGGTARTAYRVVGGGAVVVVVPSDAGEAEAAAEAARRDGTVRLDGLDVFDTVVMVGDRAAALSRAADLVLVAAAPDTAEETVAAVGNPGRAAGRICGTLTLDLAPAAAAHPSVLHRPAEGLRRLVAAEAPGVIPAPLALRGTLDAEPERLVA